MNKVVKFVNKIFTLRNEGKVELYSGPLADGGHTTVSIVTKSSEGYSQIFYDLKQLIARPNKKAVIQKISLPSLEFVYNLIKDAVEGEEDEFSRNYSQNNTDSTIHNSDTNSGSSCNSLQNDNTGKFIEVVEVISNESRDNSKGISRNSEGTTSLPSAGNESINFESDFEEISNFTQSSNVLGSKPIGIRNSVIGSLDSPF